jgi:hypothetical protein
MDCAVFTCDELLPEQLCLSLLVGNVMVMLLLLFVCKKGWLLSFLLISISRASKAA